MASDKPEFPFFNFDVKKFVGDLKMPNVDLDSIVSSSRKNIEALTQANRIAFEGFQAVARRQVEIMRETMTEAASVLRGVMSGNPGDVKVAPEVLKKAFEAALANMRELAELTSKANSDAFDVVQKRVADSIEELKALTGKAKGQ
ncbi:phasin family protein [Zavarzinia compransoris]|uniref:Phasin n=1 Tax=Zavarzinia compransoris TaxID=1264899 RepID=A0A317DZ08_9PROT|nr:TIGR01841 family phasin [Zavarzinia compransoris]PWR20017.1 phasin [Zavarzinia compransoris]TDP44863.1 phasin family protein [Zavarzinia compransoris]